MATRTSHLTGRPYFIEDDSSVERTGGVQIDWAGVNASFIDATTGKKILRAGQPIGTLAGAGLARERIVTTNPAVGLLETDAVEGDESAGLSGYSMIVGAVIYENHVPTATGTPKVIPSAIKTELAAADCTFKYRQYADDTTAV